MALSSVYSEGSGQLTTPMFEVVYVHVVEGPMKLTTPMFEGGVCACNRGGTVKLDSPFITGFKDQQLLSRDQHYVGVPGLKEEKQNPPKQLANDVPRQRQREP
ncbi:hypothetical protein OS493_009927 [Desmophyllum pertusum]|uniref:Uncharacterized protein n=1 Tax=Desmophyllum pertusum TaxID=174260 RepID=A0A9W9YEJ9_9CNID|nr:hypothetical protein OS493_009927 [Desmophyllum pertusum]